jgi:hypothetical protein
MSIMVSMPPFPLRRRVPTRHRGRIVVGLLAVLALVGTSCKGSGYDYVGSQGDHVFLRVPDTWHQFSPREMEEATGLEGSAYDWIVGFDSGPDPSLSSVLVDTPNDFPEFPAVLTYVRSIGPNEGDGFSLGSIRNAKFSVDPLVQQGQAELINPYQSVVLPGGFHGERDKFRIVLGVSTKATLTVDQIGVVDPETSKLWFVAAWCTSPCFQHHEAEINRVLESWTVEDH